MDRLESLVGVIDKYYADIPFDELLNSDAKSTVLKSITRKFNDKKYSYPSDVSRLMQRNSTYFKDRLQKSGIPSGKKIVAVLTDFLKTNNRVQNELNSSYRSATSIYGELCHYVKCKNSLKNRLKLYVSYRRLGRISLKDIDRTEILIESPDSHGELHISPWNQKGDVSPKARHIKNLFASAACSTPVGTHETSHYVSFDVSPIDILQTTPLKKGDHAYQNLTSPHVSLDQSPITSMPNITPEKCDIPHALQNLTPLKCTTVLPLNAKNMYPTGRILSSAFKDCVILEGGFCVKEKYRSIIFDAGNLNSRFYPYFLKKTYECMLTTLVHCLLNMSNI